MNKTTRRLARTAGPAAVLTGVTAVAVAGLPGTASAAPICFGARHTRVVTTARVATVTCIFGYVDGQQTFQVPNGVYHTTVDLIGGAGGAGSTPVGGGIGGVGGLGDEVRGTIPVQPHQILYIEVGGNGGDGSTGSGGTGGFNGGAAGADSHTGGGGGGGASDIRIHPILTLGGSPVTGRLIVAAGGGGGAGGGDCLAGAGGNGGDSDASAGTGGNCVGVEVGGTGGANGTIVGGGAGGIGGADGSTTGAAGGNGTAGGLVTGGAAATVGAGGGGSGLYGGGGGGGAAVSGVPHWGGGGGGGAGSSGTTNAAVRVTYIATSDEEPMVSLRFQQPQTPPKPLRGSSLTSATVADNAAAGLRLSGRRR